MHRLKNKVLSGLLLSASLVLSANALAQAHDLDEVVAKGVIRVAMYNDYPPYSSKGQGVDVDIAAALARRLNVRLDPLWFDADESVDDDMRNMVWKGHYLGYGPADVMIHAPVDPALMQRNPQVRLLAPYSRERLAIARDKVKVPQADDLSFLDQQLIGVEDASLGSIILLSYEGGKYRDRVKHFKSTSLAVAAMLRGEVAAVLAQQGEVEGLLKGKSGVAIAPPPMVGPLANRQWTVGLAVKSAHKALAESIDGAMAEMSRDGELDAIFAKHGLTHNRP